MLKTQKRYKSVFQLASQLIPFEQARLIDELREHLLGFGMWKGKKELLNIPRYVEYLRLEESRTDNGQTKIPEKFLSDLEEWNEEERD